MIWNAICDRCGGKRLNTELRREWQGLMVCRDGCWEPRHPMDKMKGRVDRQNPPWVRPEPADTFIPNLLLLYEDGSKMLLEQSSSLDLIAPAIGLEDDTP